MIIFVERNKIDISEFINGFKSSIAFIEDKLRVNLVFAEIKLRLLKKCIELCVNKIKK